jgi:hypothetical protein
MKISKTLSIVVILCSLLAVVARDHRANIREEHLIKQLRARYEKNQRYEILLDKIGIDGMYVLKNYDRCQVVSRSQAFTEISRVYAHRSVNDPRALSAKLLQGDCLDDSDYDDPVEVIRYRYCLDCKYYDVVLGEEAGHIYARFGTAKNLGGWYELAR